MTSFLHRKEHNKVARLWARERFYSDEVEEQHFKIQSKYEAAFWERSSVDDPIAPGVRQAVAEIEKTCRDVIEGKGTLYGYLNMKLTRIKRSQ